MPDQPAEIAYIRERLSDLYTRYGVEFWLHSPNRLLDGEMPINLVNRGEGERVLAVIERLESGACS